MTDSQSIALDAYACRLARLAHEERKVPAWDSTLKARFQAKREQLLSEIDQLLGPALCPLCEPDLLQSAPRSRLRQCATHSEALFVARGNYLTSRPAGSDASKPDEAPPVTMPSGATALSESAVIFSLPRFTPAIPPTTPTAPGTAATSSRLVLSTPASSTQKRPSAPKLTDGGETASNALAPFRTLARELTQQPFTPEQEEAFTQQWTDLIEHYEQQRPGAVPPLLELDAALHLRPVWPKRRSEDA